MKFSATVRTNPRIKSLEDLAKLDRRDMETMTKAIDSQFRSDERRLFATEGASGGKRWPKLSPAYARRKKKKYPGRKILVRKGPLRKSLTTKNAEHIAEWSLQPRATITVGTKNPLGRFHVKRRDPIQQTTRQARMMRGLIWRHLNMKRARVERVLKAWRGHEG